MDSTRKGETLIPTPKWFIALRVFQIVFALIIVAMTGWWIHGLYYDALGFAIVCGLFTWVIALYALLTERVSSCRRGYNTWAVLALDLLMVIFWLASLGAVADRRSKFTVSVQASCSSDGSAINSGQCSVYGRRSDDDVVGVATDAALAVLSAIAGLSALVMLLFVATFAYVCHFFRLAYTAAGSAGAGAGAGDVEKNSGAANAAAGTEMQKPAVGGQQQQQQQPLLPQEQYQYQYQYQQQPPQGVDPATYAQNANANAAAPPYDPYAPQSTAYAGAYPQQAAQQPQAQYPYSPQGTPAPGQPYQLPAQ